MIMTDLKQYMLPTQVLAKTNCEWQPLDLATVRENRDTGLMTRALFSVDATTDIAQGSEILANYGYLF